MFISLTTNKKGRGVITVYINTNKITSIEPNTDGGTAIYTDKFIAVCESIDEVLDQMYEDEDEDEEV